ncbi:MAG TPA: selenocysteine-specific translation elongation factor [Candidatus Dormibacteraeota bacterium]|nr:selenocysteine-specific translation elongation factor [Candidatus Dormibacteraeota bacterium]
MQHVVGTAGHVDHGKSTLVLALTGTDPDRLAEEKRRGMTIELGFAAWTLPGGERAGVIDVPGHRRFIRTMLAGAHGIDLVLLVVAADEGVMPQTREHLAICGLLGARRAVVALTKSDLVDADMLELARAEVEEVIRESPLRGAPVIACSAVTREGLDELSRTVERELAGVPQRPDRGRPRLFVDRAFSLPGFGPVVTGTLEGGRLHTGDDVLVLPAGLRARVRGLQHHGDDVQRAEPGRRTAVNLGGVDIAELDHGMALVLPATLAATTRLDVRLRVLDDAPAPVRHRGPVMVYLGTQEVPASAWLLEGSELEPGGEGFVQLHLDAPVVASPGDHVVVRRASPPATLGGGVVLDVAPKRHRRRDPAVAAALARRAGGEVPALVQEELRKARLGVDLATLVRLAGAGRGEIEAAVAALGDAVLPFGERRWIARERWDDLRQRALRILAAYHDAEPLRAGMPREEWRSRLRLNATAGADAVRLLRKDGAVEENEGTLRLPGRGRAVSGTARASADRIVALLDAQPLDPPGMPELRAAGLDAALLRLLVDEHRVVRLSADVALSSAAYAGAVEAVAEYLTEHDGATVAALRDHLGATRRIVVPLLEHLDAARVTYRDGDLRRLRARRPGAEAG